MKTPTLHPANPVRRALLPLLLLLWLGAALAEDQRHIFPDPVGEVDRILAMETPPAGIVFDIEAWDERALDEHFPWLMQQIPRIHQRFPDLPVAIVTHGREQFQLTTDATAHSGDVQAMVADFQQLGAGVYVCKTHASWREVPPEAFIDSVIVAESGPATVNDYIALGYKLVILDKIPLEKLITLLPEE